MKINKCGYCDKLFTLPYCGLCPRCGSINWISVNIKEDHADNRQLDLFNFTLENPIQHKTI